MGNISEDTLDPSTITRPSVRRRDPWRGMSWAIAMLVVALALVVMLAGCGSDESAPPPARTTTATPTPTASPTPTVPVMPEAAKQHTKEGAEAFVRYFFASVESASLTGETAPLHDLVLGGCTGCNGGIDGIEKVYAEGGHLLGTKYRVHIVSASAGHGNASTEVAQVNAVVTTPPSDAVYPDPAKNHHYEGGTRTYRLSLIDQGQGWRIGSLDTTA